MQAGASHYQDMFENRLVSPHSWNAVPLSLNANICCLFFGVKQFSDQMALLVLVQSTDVSIVNASDTFLELTGWSREFLGKLLDLDAK